MNLAPTYTYMHYKTVESKGNFQNGTYRVLCMFIGTEICNKSIETGAEAYPFTSGRWLSGDRDEWGASVTCVCNLQEQLTLPCCLTHYCVWGGHRDF